MTSKDETRQSIAAIYDASESALREACADYASIVGVIVKPVAGEHYVTSRVKARRSLIRKLAKMAAAACVAGARSPTRSEFE